MYYVKANGKEHREENLKKSRENATTSIDLSQVKYHVGIHFRVGLHMTFISRYLCQKKSNIWNTSATSKEIFSTSTIRYFCRYFYISYTIHCRTSKHLLFKRIRHKYQEIELSSTVYKSHQFLHKLELILAFINLKQILQCAWCQFTLNFVNLRYQSI